MAVQGCGNVGGNTARIFYHRGAIVVAISAGSAALENQIIKDVVEKLVCKYIVAGANGPTTTDAGLVLEKRGIKLLPDIFANSGGVIVFYFEWVQNIQEMTWEKPQVKEMLETIMTKG